MSATSHVPDAGDWQAGFLAVLPALQAHARIQFRRLPAERKEDAVQEAVAAACVNYQRLAVQGRLHVARPGPLADFAVRHVRLGRHVGGRQDGARDVLSPAAQRRRGLRVSRYEQFDSSVEHSRKRSGDDDKGWEVAAVEDRRTPVPDLAAFRVDFPQWLDTLSPRDRQVAALLAAGNGTAEVAGRCGLTAGRVSQLRRTYERRWREFHGERGRGGSRPAAVAA
jgi:hypothetical protein